MKYVPVIWHKKDFVDITDGENNNNKKKTIIIFKTSSCLNKCPP